VLAAVEAIRENRGAEYGAVWSRPTAMKRERMRASIFTLSKREVSEIN
jgi:hypothetical protein